MLHPNTCAGSGVRLKFTLSLLSVILLTGMATAAPSFSPDQGKMPLTVQFTFPGGDQCDSVSWDFGDDTTSDEVSPSHMYKEMSFFYPQCICTLPGAKITYNFNKIVSSNADMPDPDSADQHYPVETIPEISAGTLPLDEQTKQGKGLYAIGLYDDAAESYKKAIQISGSDPEILAKFGDIMAGLTRWTDAASAYNQSLAIREDPAVLNAYGAALIKLKKYDEALGVFNRTLTIEPGNASALTGIGKAFELLKKADESAAAYQKSLEIDDSQSSAWMGYGNVLSTLEKYPEAITAYEKAISLGVTGADIYTKYGGVLRKAGRDGDAGRAMSTARSFQGQLYSSSGDYSPRCSAGGVMG
jgi:Flp pilus assembly protein TadD